MRVGRSAIISPKELWRERPGRNWPLSSRQHAEHRESGMQGGDADATVAVFVVTTAPSSTTCGNSGVKRVGRYSQHSRRRSSWKGSRDHHDTGAFADHAARADQQALASTLRGDLPTVRGSYVTLRPHHERDHQRVLSRAGVPCHLDSRVRHRTIVVGAWSQASARTQDLLSTTIGSSMSDVAVRRRRVFSLVANPIVVFCPWKERSAVLRYARLA